MVQTEELDFAGVSGLGYLYVERRSWYLVPAILHRYHIATDALWRVRHLVQSTAAVYHLRTHAVPGWVLRNHTDTDIDQMAILATFLGPAFAASRVQHLSDLHSKFA